MKYVRRTSYDIKDNFIPNLLKDRGIINEDNEETYFHPTEEVELNSCQLDNIDAGIKLLEKNLNNKILIIVDSDFDGFSSAALMYNYLKLYSDDIERYSIDECFIEISGFRDPVKLAYTIKEDIKKKFGFTVNVGVGNNKLLAKMASDFEKPDKVHTLFYDEIEKKMWPLDIENLFMIGKSYSKKLRNLNINTIYDLAHSDENMLKIYFKSMGIKMFEYANGIDNSKVESDYGLPKSISTSEVLPYDYGDREKIYKVIKDLSMQTGKKLREKNMYASLVHIGIKYNDFSKVSKQVSLNNYISSDIDIYNYAVTLFDKLWVDEDKKVRGLAVGVANLSETYIEQLDLFNVNNNKKNNVKVQKTIDEIRKKYGDNSIIYADDIKN